MKEEWLPVGGYEGLYEVSNLGRVRSVERYIFDHGLETERYVPSTVLKPWRSSHKTKDHVYYQMVTLCRNGKIKRVGVHRLVAKAFIPNPLNKPQINHIDGNPQNNNVKNLEWVTNGENSQHAYDNNLNQEGQLRIEYQGEIHSLTYWCRKLKINYDRTWTRIKRLGWSVEKAFEE